MYAVRKRLMLAATLMAVAGLPQAPGRAAAKVASEVQTIGWATLLPEDERKNFNPNPPPPVHSYLGEGSLPALQSGSYTPNPDLNDKTVKIPGFVVPLDTDKKGDLVDFLLVPYFGACIHVPPPPPNQIVYVKMKKAVPLSSMQDAQWVIGTLHASIKKSDLGAAAYELDGTTLQPYHYNVQ